MIEVTTARDMRAWSRGRRAAGRRVGLVPTMGYLHEAHLTLVDRARDLADDVVISLFVNPAQFGPDEDFAAYPRDPDRDRAAAAGRGVTCLFMPAVGEVYPDDPLITFHPGILGAHLCGPHRPGHFAGVLLVVAKLFNMVEPDVAVFGRKDAQQAILLRRLALDLSFAVEIDVAPLVRERDGLALSSRNVYLSPEERTRALVLVGALRAGHAVFAAGERDAVRVVGAARAALDAGTAEVEYVELVGPHDAQPVATAAADSILAVAARVGRTRLIDNAILGAGPAGDPHVDV